MVLRVCCARIKPKLTMCKASALPSIPAILWLYIFLDHWGNMIWGNKPASGLADIILKRRVGLSSSAKFKADIRDHRFHLHHLHNETLSSRCVGLCWEIGLIWNTSPLTNISAPCLGKSRLIMQADLSVRFISRLLFSCDFIYLFLSNVALYSLCVWTWIFNKNKNS